MPIRLSLDLCKCKLGNHTKPHKCCGIKTVYIYFLASLVNQNKNSIYFMNFTLRPFIVIALTEHNCKSC